MTPQGLEEVKQRIRAINNQARLFETINAQIPLDQVLGLGAFDLDRILQIEPDFLGEDEHEHDDQITSVSLHSERPLDPENFHNWISEITSTRGQDLLRTKGIIAFPNEPKRFVVQGVHMLLSGDLQDRTWNEGEPRISRLVFIGRNLDGDELAREFAALAA
ncbi:GTP-binding protein [Erythrobacter sp. QSSC1-22B]|uniref:CobW family GTP-binding protein n=1 Tax=Erythrobacter sp. QSSC1-22B TaxID=1860125 RepID=UPI0035176630